MRNYNLDGYVVGSKSIDYDYNKKMWIVGPPFGDHVLTDRIKEICKNHNFDIDGTMRLHTCEGFNSEHNLKIITDVLKSHYGMSYSGKVIFDQGSLSFHKKGMKQDGVWIVPNAAFTYGALKEQFSENTPQINYNRDLSRTFCVLYARSSYDRSRIFDHMVRNYYDDGTFIYRDSHVDYGDLSYYKPENHINQKYNNVYDNKDSEYVADNTAQYILDDIQHRANECFLNIISETNYYEDNSNFITEKTATSMLSGFPFITSTSVGYYDILKDLGFKTFSNFWDESFNNITDHVERTDVLLNNLDEIAKRFSTVESRKNAIEKMKPILEHNQQRWIDIWNDDHSEYLKPFGYKEILRTISSSIQDSPY